MINVGVVGCGKIAQVRHLPEYNANPLANIAGIYDLDKSRAEENAKKYHTKVYPTYDAMLKDSMIDAVSICTANVSHCEMSVKAMEAGKHVLCEKPMAVTYEECKLMEETARITKRFLMIGYNQRLTKTHVEARKLIEDGEIGKILTIKNSFGHAGPENWAVDKKDVWFFDRKTAAIGAMADLGIHKTDLIQFLAGKKVKNVSSLLSTLDKFDQDGNPIAVDDNAVCIYELEGGALGTMSASWTYYGDEDNSTILYGTDGCLKIYCDPRYSIIVEKKNGQKVLYDIDKMQTNHIQNNSGVDSWINSLVNNREPEISGKEALNSMKVVFAAIESSKSGCKVCVDDFGN